MDIGLLILRVAFGGAVALHGAQKVLPSSQGGMGIAATKGFIENLGFRPAAPFAWALAGIEIVAGLALAFGFATPIAAGSVIAVMTAAILAVHLGKGFFAQNGGFELPFVIGTAALATAFAGAGEWSVDRALGWELAGEAWGIAAALGGMFLGSLSVATRSLRLPRLAGRRTAHA